jgi:hypothetical protein
MTQSAIVPDGNELPGTPDPAAALVDAQAISPRMLAAADDGRYGILAISFPVVLAWVAVGGQRLGLSLECVGYPGRAPAGCPWDLASNTALPADRWPVGGRSPAVFRTDWSPSNHNAPYLACDRIGLATHLNWPREVPHLVWTPSKTLCDYLEQMHAALDGSVLPVRS